MFVAEASFELSLQPSFSHVVFAHCTVHLANNNIPVNQCQNFFEFPQLFQFSDDSLIISYFLCFSPVFLHIVKSLTHSYLAFWLV